MNEDDTALLRSAGDGDAAALRTLLKRHGRQVWDDIQREIGAPWRSAIDADDVMQVTYMEAFLQIHRLAARDAAGFVGWLRRMARNNLRDAIRELGRKKRPDPMRRVSGSPEDGSDVALVQLLGATSTTPSRALAAGEIGLLIDAALDRLPPDYGRVVRLYDLEERAIGDVAGLMGRSPGAVHMLRARAHDRLRELLGSEARFFSHPS